MTCPAGPPANSGLVTYRPGRARVRSPGSAAPPTRMPAPYLVNGSLDPLRRPRLRVGSREVGGVRLGTQDLPFERREDDLVVETVVPALGAALLRIR